MHSGALLFDPVFFGEDTGERREYARMARFNSRPQREQRPMYVGPDGQLHYKYDASVNNPHWNRMNMASRSLDGRISPNQYQRQASPMT